MKRALLFLIGCFGLIEFSLEAQESGGTSIRSSLARQFQSVLAAVTFTKQPRSLSPDSIVHSTEQIPPSKKSSKQRLCDLHQPTKAVIYPDLTNSNHAKMQQSISSTALASKSIPQDDFNLSLPSRGRSESQDNFGFYVDVPDSPKFPKSSLIRSDSFERNNMSRPLGFTHKPSSFGSVTSSYDELEKFAKKGVSNQCCPAPSPSPYDHVVPSPSPDVTSSSNK